MLIDRCETSSSYLGIVRNCQITLLSGNTFQRIVYTAKFVHCDSHLALANMIRQCHMMLLWDWDDPPPMMLDQ